jgi:hypothetical protein
MTLVCACGGRDPALAIPGPSGSSATASATPAPGNGPRPLEVSGVDASVPEPSGRPGRTTSPVPSAKCDDKCAGAATPALAEMLSNVARRSRRCYEAELAKSPQLSGKILVEVKVDAAGALCAVDVPASEPALKDVAACTKKTFEDARDLPAPEGGCLIARVPITYVQAKDGGRD